MCTLLIALFLTLVLLLFLLLHGSQVSRAAAESDLLVALAVGFAFGWLALVAWMTPHADPLQGVSDVALIAMGGWIMHRITDSLLATWFFVLAWVLIGACMGPLLTGS